MECPWSRMDGQSRASRRERRYGERHQDDRSSRPISPRLPGRVGSVAPGANPSFLAIHPNGRVLFAVNELEQYNGRPTGAVSAFAIETNTGVLARLNEQPSEGGAPCYVSVDRSAQVVLVANYVGGSIALLPIQPN